MQAYFKRLPEDIRAVINRLAGLSRARRQPAYLVGGFVRDLLLARPNFDVDIVVEGDALGIAEQFARLVRAGLTRHRRFGTATVLLASGRKIDFATARKETYPYPGSLPVVAPGSLQDDLYRRDFTINTMAVALSERDLGGIIDYFGGRQDLRRRKIRILHDLSFIDDPTRILRAVRFEQRFDFHIEPHTLRLLKSAAADGMVSQVQPQRIRDELILMLQENDPAGPLWRMRALTGLGFIHPGLAVTEKTRALFKSVKHQLAWFEKSVVTRAKPEPWLLYCMALIDSLRESQARAVCEKFVFKKGEQHSIMDYKRLNAKLSHTLGKRGLKPSQVYDLLSPLDDAVILMLRAQYPLAAVKKYTADFLCRNRGVRTLISGEDLQRLGLVPGPRYQILLTGVLHARLDGLIRRRAEELTHVKKLILGR